MSTTRLAWPIKQRRLNAHVAASWINSAKVMNG